MWLVYLILLVAAIALSAGLTALVRAVAPRVGFVDKPNARKVHVKPTPLGGGLAIIFTNFLVIGAIVFAAFHMGEHPSLARLGANVPRYLAGVLLVHKRLAVIAAGALVLMVMGLIDDKKNLGAWPKLFVQIAVAAGLAAAGIRVTLFIAWEPASWILTIGWLIFVMNSFNLLDNMDGLSSGVAFIIAAVFFVVAVETGQVFFSVALLIFAGSLIGYLLHNFPPARIFMGDTGSYFLGYFLGVTSVQFTFVHNGAGDASLLPFALPFILFAIPFYDTLSVIFIRVSEGRHPFDADKRHFSHRLTDLGLKTREAVLAIYAATLATAFPAVYLYDLSRYALLGAVIQALLVLLVVAILEHAGARKKKA